MHSAAFVLATLLALSVSGVSGRERSVAEHVGRVAHVVDGQSLEILMGPKRVRVRLAGIQVPAHGQPFGLRSRQSLVQLCAGEVATLQEQARARNGLRLGKVTCNGIDAANEQVSRGMARVSEEFEAPPDLRALEDKAREARRGLWSSQNEIARRELQ